MALIIGGSSYAVVAGKELVSSISSSTDTYISGDNSNISVFMNKLTSNIYYNYSGGSQTLTKSGDTFTYVTKFACEACVYNTSVFRYIPTDITLNFTDTSSSLMYAHLYMTGVKLNILSNGSYYRIGTENYTDGSEDIPKNANVRVYLNQTTNHQYRWTITYVNKNSQTITKNYNITLEDLFTWATKMFTNSPSNAFLDVLNYEYTGTTFTFKFKINAGINYN